MFGPDLWIAAAALTAGQITRAVTGFGSALVAVPVLVMVWSPVEAVAVASLIDVVTGAALWPSVRHKVIPRLLAATLVGQVVGQWVGTGLLMSLPSDRLKLLLGLILLPLAIDVLVRPVRPGRGEWDRMPEPAGPVLAAGVVVGTLGGTMSGAIGAGGPPIVFFARHYFSRETFRAQVMATFLIGSFPLLTMLGWRGAIGGLDIQRTLVLLPVVFGGAWLGNRLAGRLDAVRFGRLVGAVLVVAALTLLAQ